MKLNRRLKEKKNKKLKVKKVKKEEKVKLSHYLQNLYKLELTF
jgi:hypothetical protein